MQKIATQSSLIPLYRMLIVSTLLALAAVMAYFILPERKLRILPELDSESHLFFDGQKGGNTMAGWINPKEFHFNCTASTSAIDTPYCGLSINFHSLKQSEDYSSYRHMEVKIRYLGNNHRLRLKIHSFKPAQSDGDTRETLQGVEVSLLAEETNKPLMIEDHNWSGFDNGSSMDISLDLVPPIAPGEHDIKLEYIDIRGKLLKAESWYLGVAVFWLLSNLLFISRHLMLQEKRIRNDAQRLSTLAHYSNDLQQESQHYKLLSSTDTLTGALNRNGFAAEMSQRSPNGKMQHNTTLMIIDLDNFKRINDSLGHDTGDVVLRETAKVIHKNTRNTDRFIRWGGEEFILYCENTNAQQALLIAEKIRAAVETIKINCHGNNISVTVSIGLSIAVAQENFDSLFHRTDQALYKAKHLGRNCVVLSEAE